MHLDKLIVINSEEDYNEKRKDFEKMETQELFDWFVNGYNIVGHSISKDLWEIAKNGKEKVNYKGKEIDLNDFRIRNGIGAIVYNLNLEKFLAIKYNIKDENYWGLVKGGREEAENTLQTLKREMWEETNLIPKKIILEKPYFTLHTYLKGETIIKAYNNWYLTFVDKENVKLSHEHTDYKWVSLKEAKKLITHEQHYKILEYYESFCNLD